MVRIKVNLKSSKNNCEVITLLNPGFESEEPQIILPKRVAELLKLEKKEEYQYKVAGGQKIRVYLGNEPVHLRIILEDKSTEEYKFLPIISEDEEEVIISDTGISLMGIVIEDAGKGLWRIKNDAKIRHSYVEQLW